MTAEEYLKDNPKFKLMKNKMSLEFAEAYHKSKVEAISDKKTNDLLNDLALYFEANNEGDTTNGFLNRIKQQLLKQ